MDVLRYSTMITRALAWVKRYAIFGAFAFAACQGTAPDDLLLDAQPTALVFVKSNDSSTLDNNFIGGSAASDLYMLTPISPNGQLRNLTDAWTGDNGAVADPEISYDGLKVIFSMRKKGANNFDIYEMNLNGDPKLRQVTTSPFDDADPAYLPNGKIAFTSNRRNIRDEYERRRVENLFTMNADGSNQQCISFNNSDDFDPIVLADGRIVWTRWEHHGNENRFPLFFTEPDGRSTFLFFGTHQGGFHRNFFHPRELPDGKVVAVMSSAVLVDRGPLVILNSDQTTGDPPQASDYINITPNVPPNGDDKGSFKYPFPLPDGRIVASFSANGAENGDYGLYTIKRDGTNLTLLYNDPQTDEMDAVVVAPRPKPPVRPEAIDNNDSTGVFVNQNVYFRQNNDGQLRPNQAMQEIKQVMVIEGIPVLPNESSMEIGMNTPFERRRILGVAPVYADGSFSIRVPANTPISFNTLDSLGRAVVIKRNWLYARPGEKVTNCTGCHGPRGQKSNPNPIALGQTPTNLVVPVSQRKSFSFQNAIEPIIKKSCAITQCHDDVGVGGLSLSLAKTTNFSVAYENLVNGAHRSASGNKDLVTSDNVPFSRNSYLADVLLGVGLRKTEGKTAHPDGANALTRDEIKAFLTWIDLGGQYR